MKALFTLQFWCEVDSADEAAKLVMEADQSGRMNVEASLERAGASMDDLRGRFGWLGGSFWLLDEDKVVQ